MASDEGKVVVGAHISEPETGGFREFLWNGKKKEFLGRTAGSWAKITIFYVIFYGCLAGWFAGLLNVFFLTLSATKPTYFGRDSLLQDNPGLGLRPAPVYDTALIRFASGKPSSFKPYTDHLEAYLKNYEIDQVSGSNIKECQPWAAGFELGEEDACKIDLDTALPSWCQKGSSYNYEDGKPCVLLKMNKLYGFEPKTYVDRTALLADQELDKLPRFMAFAGQNMSVGVSCDGENAADRENINSIEFHPSQGISKVYFPYLNQEGYRAPLLLAKFDVKKRVVVQITCKLYAENIDNSGGQENRGTLHFELMID